VLVPYLRSTITPIILIFTACFVDVSHANDAQPSNKEESIFGYWKQVGGYSWIESGDSNDETESPQRKKHIFEMNKPSDDVFYRLLSDYDEKTIYSYALSERYKDKDRECYGTFKTPLTKSGPNTYSSKHSVKIEFLLVDEQLQVTHFDKHGQEKSQRVYEREHSSTPIDMLEQDCENSIFGFWEVRKLISPSKREVPTVDSFYFDIRTIDEGVITKFSYSKFRECFLTSNDRLTYQSEGRYLDKDGEKFSLLIADQEINLYDFQYLLNQWVSTIYVGTRGPDSLMQSVKERVCGQEEVDKFNSLIQSK